MELVKEDMFESVKLVFSSFFGLPLYLVYTKNGVQV